ncbi:hypothetical protein ABI59_16250 [Acidobacteria bacterium Mor1]|nr:hypothetical protein ABI59_16250 [Acidobacteria bacterium Mor1]
MTAGGFVAFLVRFVAGWAGALLFGGMVFGRAVFQAGNPAFRCMMIGGLCAAIFAGTRSSNKRTALAVIAGYGSWQFVLAREAGVQLQLTSSASQIALGLGIFLVALIYDALAVEGWRVGKFLVAGPALAGVYLALSPLKFFGGLPHSPLQVDIALAFLIGNGVAFGIEMAELYPALSPEDRAELEEGEPAEPSEEPEALEEEASPQAGREVSS